jgi:hypothetical protein
MENKVQVKSEKGAFQDRPRLCYSKSAIIVCISASYKEHKKQQKLRIQIFQKENTKVRFFAPKSMCLRSIR